ncbi:hypothetical protein ANCDUO_22145, partial [Ancylostoma duodenale]
HYVCQNLPDALLIIAEAEETWKKREHFTELCMDPIIRKFAVDQLDALLDNQTFPLFILPFIQVGVTILSQ